MDLMLLSLSIKVFQFEFSYQRVLVKEFISSVCLSKSAGQRIYRSNSLPIKECWSKSLSLKQSAYQRVLVKEFIAQTVCLSKSAGQRVYRSVCLSKSAGQRVCRSNSLPIKECRSKEFTAQTDSLLLEESTCQRVLSIDLLLK